MRIIIVALSIAIALPAFAQSEVSGICRVVDGDTIFAGAVEVRFQGVAAPEDPRDSGGKEATAYVRQICEGRQVRCELDGTKTRGREVGICYVGGQDIGGRVIAAGLARDCPRFSKGRYRNLEQPQARRLVFPGYCSPR